MQRFANFVTGSLTVEISGMTAVSFMNFCAVKGITFWNIEELERRRIKACINIIGYRELKKLSRESKWTVKVCRKNGVPFFLYKLKKRWAFAAFLIAAIVTCWIFSLFIWDIEVVGNENISSGEILSALENAGVGIGTFSPTIEYRSLKNRVLGEINELSFLAVNVYGSKAVVVVRERTEKPDILDETEGIKIVASRSGIIDSISTLEGNPLVAEGDTVLEGEVLISGVMDSIDGDVRYVHALGDVYARTWYEFSAQIPLQQTVKVYTEDIKTKKALIIGDKRINLYSDGGIALDEYDKITKKTTITLPGGFVLPFAVVTDNYVEYDTSVSEWDAALAERFLQERLLEILKEQIGDGEIVKTGFTATEKDGVLTVTLNAECRENIGEEVPLSLNDIRPNENEEEANGT